MREREPREEEIHKSFTSDVENSDKLSTAEVQQKANTMLENLELDLESLRGIQVLDIGSGPSIIARAAKDKGIESVISMDKRTIALSKRTDVDKKVNANAQALPLANDSIDLIISHGAPPTIRGGMETPQAQEEGAINMFDEMERVLSAEGEARIVSPSLHFLDMKDDKELEQLLKRPFKDSTPNEEERRELRTMAKIEVSTNFLLENGYNIELKENDIDHKFKNFNYYWVLKKRNKEKK